MIFMGFFILSKMNLITPVLLKYVENNKNELEYKWWQQIFDRAVSILFVKEPDYNLDIRCHENVLILKPK